jgi:hypothetical protein
MIVMCVQVIHHDIDALGFWMDHIDQVAPGMRKISLRTAISDQHLASTYLGFHKEEQVACAVCIRNPVGSPVQVPEPVEL